MTPNDMEEGKIYFCNYYTIVDAEQIPLLAGQGIPTARINGCGQILKRDKENGLCLVGDLVSLKEYIVPYEHLTEIQEQ